MNLDTEQLLSESTNPCPNRLGKVLIGTAATLGMFLAAMDTSLNVALPSMTKDLDADLQSIQWVIVAFIA
ncbi:MAG: MFS transporter, partial [Chloroflexota bacterium]|nr:MFS transporter [Chloroflexota bacterium]